MDSIKSFLKDDFNGKINQKIWCLKRVERHSWRISSERSRTGKTSLEITLHKGDKSDTTRDNKPTERAEFSEQENILASLNTNIWYAFSFYFPKDFIILNNRLIFTQWKQFYREEKQSPFLSFRYINGQLSFRVMGKNGLNQKYLWPKDPRGNWHDVLVNYRLSENLEGFVKVLIDKDILTEYEGPLGFDFIKKLTYFKMGLYRDSIEIPQTIFLDRFRRGPVKQACIS